MFRIYKAGIIRVATILLGPMVLGSIKLGPKSWMILSTQVGSVFQELPPEESD